MKSNPTTISREEEILVHWHRVAAHRGPVSGEGGRRSNLLLFSMVILLWGAGRPRLCGVYLCGSNFKKF